MTRSALTPVVIEKDKVAKTVLPIAFHGREVALEARAYRKELSLEMTSDEIAEAQRQARHYLLTTSVQASA